VNLAEVPTIEEAADVLRDAKSVRFEGGGTKLGWGDPVEDADTKISTRHLARIVEHNSADLTAILEAGITLGQAQDELGAAGQRLAVDPPTHGAATIGGIVATGDSGPLRHRYGAIRDLLLGCTVVLGDGTIAKSGGKVIKNVAGYDLAKLFAGSFGTLGLVARVAVRLQPLPPRTVTLSAESGEPAVLQRVILTLSRLPLELESLDLRFDDRKGAVLARCAGADPETRVDAAARELESLQVGLESIDDDEPVWEQQRSAQRSIAGAILKVSALPTAIAHVIEAALAAGGRVTGRAGLGIFWIELRGETAEIVASIDEIRSTLGKFASVVLDAPEEVRRKVDVWGRTEDGALALMRRIKERFDPGRVCNPGVFVGGI
jgi:glycolate oxidase FAD binding subunit